MSHLRFIGRALHVKNSLNLFWLRFYPFLSDYAAKVFDLRLTEKTLNDFAFETHTGQLCKYCIELIQVFLIAALSDNESIVNKFLYTFNVVGELIDPVLEYVIRGDAYTHWKSIVLILSK